MKLGCIILAGGLATRMGGGDKGFKEVDGEAIIKRVMKAVSGKVDCLKINANGDPTRFEELGLEVVSDRVEGFVGPLAGVLAGMEAMADCDYILSVPTDTPFLPEDLIERLVEPIAQGEAEIVMARSGGFDHPVIALWPTHLKDALHDALVEEEIRKIKQWVSRYRYCSVEWEIGDIDPFFNANSPDDLASLKA